MKKELDSLKENKIALSNKTNKNSLENESLKQTIEKLYNDKKKLIDDQDVLT